MSNRPRGLTRRRALIIVVTLLALGLGLWSRTTCVSLGLSRGVWVKQCPDGALRQTISLSAPSLKRGAPSTISVAATATWVSGPNDTRHTQPLKRFTTELSLVSGATVTPLPPSDWALEGVAARTEVALPQVPDGDYLLRARVVSTVGESTLDVPLALYAPGRFHVLTDRPLYEPGNTVRFRALALKANDLTPLEDRPGRWLVTDPDGELLLEEKAPSGPWGVVTGSFPLDKGARSGTWTVTWASGGDVATRTFTVKPFTLPRFRLEASTDKPFYQRGERPVLKGSVKYASGAPVANAKVELRWRVQGAWPPPTSWVSGDALPRLTTTSANGGFTVELPAIPMDLVGQATLAAALAAIDPAGDRVEGSAGVLLSEDAIAVQAVSELPAGLVEGFNNRLFLRATTADGRLLEGVTLNVRRLWEPADTGTDASVDEDGVASLQLDPGPPVNIIIPALPFRPPPPTPKLTRSNLEERLEGDVTLADRLTFDRLQAKLERCTRLVIDGEGGVEASLLVNAAGKVTAVTTDEGRLSACVKQTLLEAGFGAGRERFFDVTFRFDDSELPGLRAELDAAPEVPGSTGPWPTRCSTPATACRPASSPARFPGC